MSSRRCSSLEINAVALRNTSTAATAYSFATCRSISVMPAISHQTSPQKNSTGANPFTPNLSTPVGDRLPTTTTTAPTATSSGVTNLVSRRGTDPGLYGGTRNATSCDQEQMIQFLKDNPDKGAAWASVEGISTAQLETFIRGLTPVILLADTRVTNHGFSNGRATSLQSVLQAGTAVLIDSTGVPRAKCACGNPLLPPVAARGRTTQRGDPWPGFDPAAPVVVSAGPTTINVTLIDINTGVPFDRPVATSGGSDVDAPPDLVSSLTVDVGGTTTTTSTTTTSTTAPAVPTDVTSTGTGGANSEFPNGQFPASLAVDGDVTTSWFSAGPGAGPGIFTWTGPPKPFTITSVTIVGNGDNADPANRKGFGFGHVEVVLLLGGSEVFHQGFDLPGTPDPTVSVQPNVVADTVQLTFTGRESHDCGGFAELQIQGS